MLAVVKQNGFNWDVFSN